MASRVNQGLRTRAKPAVSKKSVQKTVSKPLSLWALKRKQLFQELLAGTTAQSRVYRTFERFGRTRIPTVASLLAPVASLRLSPKTVEELREYAINLIAHRKSLVAIQRVENTPQAIFSRNFNRFLIFPKRARLLQTKWANVLLLSTPDFKHACRGNGGLYSNELGLAIADKKLIIIDADKVRGKALDRVIDHETLHLSVYSHPLNRTVNFDYPLRERTENTRRINQAIVEEFSAHLIDGDIRKFCQGRASNGDRSQFYRSEIRRGGPFLYESYIFSRLGVFDRETRNWFVRNQVPKFEESTRKNYRVVSAALRTGKISPKQLADLIVNIRDYHKIHQRLPELLRLRGISVSD